MSKLLQLRQAIGSMLLLFGAIVMVGWWTRTEAVVQMIPGAVAMAWNTALCFMLAGIALIVQGEHGKAGVIAQRGAGAAMLVIAAAAALQNILGVDFGIDQLVVKAWIHDTNPHPGRLAPMTSLGFMLAGVFFFCSNGTRAAASAILHSRCSRSPCSCWAWSV